MTTLPADVSAPIVAILESKNNHVFAVGTRDVPIGQHTVYGFNESSNSSVETNSLLIICLCRLAQ